MQKEILLLFPPISSRKNPYLSIPVLARYLKKKNIPVSAEDVGLLFWNKFLDSQQRFYDSCSILKDRFLCLNTKDSLNFREIVEYMRLARLNRALGNFENKSFYEFPDELLLNIMMTPYFPNIYIEKPFNRLFTSFNEFSSNDITDSIKADLFYNEIVEEIISEILKKNKPLIVGISVVFNNQVLPAFYISSIIKKISPQTHVTIGGPFVTLHFREIKNQKVFDIVDSIIVDEGEIPLEMLYHELNQDKPADFNNVPNLIWFDGSKINYNKSAKPIDFKNLNSPDFGIMPLDSYNTDRDKIIYSFRLSRGCYWQQCAFCRTDISFCRNYSQPEYESVFDAIKTAMNDYGARYFLFSDESSHPDLLEYLSQRIIENKLNIKWFTHTRFHKSLTRERFKLFKEAGCFSLTLGLESYNDRLLKLMKKGTSVELINKVIDSNSGILPMGVYMILGFPTETEEEAVVGHMALEQLYKDRKVSDVSYSQFNITYGSDIWNNPSKYDITKIYIDESLDLLPDAYHFDCSGMSCQRAGEFFQDFPETFRGKEDTSFREIDINKKNIEMNYLLDDIKTNIKKNLFSLNSLAFVKWLDSVDMTMQRT